MPHQNGLVTHPHAAENTKIISVAFDELRATTGVVKLRGAAIVTSSGTQRWAPGDPLPACIAEAAAGERTVVVDDWHLSSRGAWLRAGWPLPARLVDLAKWHRAAGELGANARLGRARGDTAIATALSMYETRTKQWPIVRSERSIQNVDRVINERGFAFDVETARNLAAVASEIEESLARRTGRSMKALRDPARFLQTLDGLGVSLPDAQRRTLESALTDPELPSEAATMIEGRIGVSSNTRAKVYAGLRSVDGDERVRDTLVYFGSHTGRWTSGGFQVHNLPHSGPHAERTVELVRARDVSGIIDCAATAALPVTTIISQAVRALIVAPHGRELVVGDWSSFEPRVARWLVDDHAGLDHYRQADPYGGFASTIFGVELADVSKEQHALAKLAEISCPYGIGATRLESYGDVRGIDWQSAEMSAEEVVNVWRESNPAITEAWAEIEVALSAAAGGSTGYKDVGRLGFRVRPSELSIVLPSRRVVRFGGVVADWSRGRAEYSVEIRGQRVHVWGSRIFQNVTQGVCRDILADALVRADARGMAVVMHVHDEIVAEMLAGQGFGLLREIMETAPSWADGLPLAAKLETRRRYA